MRQRRIHYLAVAAALVALAVPSATRAVAETKAGDAAAVAEWSREAQRAVTPAGPNGIFGTENYGNKFPGEAAVYLGIVHGAIYDTTAAIEGGYEPYAVGVVARPGASLPAAIATVTHHILVGLQPELGLTPEQQAGLDERYANYLSAIPDSAMKSDGIDVGERVAAATIALRANDGRGANPQYGQGAFVPPPAGPGVWDPGTAPAVGLRLSGMRPLALKSAAQFRPDGPSALSSDVYVKDFAQVKDLGRSNSSVRTEEQTNLGLFWTDHDLRQWNDGLLGIAEAHGLDAMKTARLLAMAHVSGGDGMIGCFEAKYHYWFWRPYQAIPRADSDGNAATELDATWQPLRPTPNFPEYPSAHACHTSAIATALKRFFGTDKVSFTLDSRIIGATRSYNRFEQVVKEVNRARVLSGFHFFNSDVEGAVLGRKVGGYVANNFFQQRDS